MTIHNQRVDDLTKIYAMLVGKRFADLRESELRILYAWELWGDGMDIEQIFNEMNWGKACEECPIPMAEIRQHLKNTFKTRYDDDTIIEKEIANV
jgi:inhibitor of KinA sporulation pathway (predicted exonuclease)